MADKKYDPVESAIIAKRGQDFSRVANTARKLQDQAKADLIKSGKYNAADFAKKAKVTENRLDDYRDEYMSENAIDNAPTPEMRDQLRTSRNERAAKAYEARKASGEEDNFKKGGTVKRSSASKRADGCAIRGKTRA